MRILKDLFGLFYPKVCGVCSDYLLKNEIVLCTNCRHDLPLTEITNFHQNKITAIFYGKIAVESAYSFLFFRKENSVQQLIHELKYKSNEEIGIFFGKWIGLHLKEQNAFSTVDAVVPVPLHPRKLRSRGYNQVTKFAINISNYLEKPFVDNLLFRVTNSETQTLKSRLERFKNVGTKFSVQDKNLKKYTHVLLVDDVITTGATLIACAKEMQEKLNCKVSIVTLAYTE